jgi:hypothetical protein
VRCSRGFDGVDHLVPGAVGFRLECPRMPQGADLSVTLTGYVVIDDVQAICRASNDRCIGFDVVVDHGDTVNVPFDRCMTPGARDVNPVLMGYGTMSVPTFREGLVTAHVAVRKVTADNGKCFGRIGFDDTARLELRARHLAPASRP